MSASPPPQKQRRHNISQACRNCRHRKKKCDGQKPVCQTCLVYKVSDWTHTIELTSGRLRLELEDRLAQERLPL